jgi:hypothetical protein
MSKSNNDTGVRRNGKLLRYDDTRREQKAAVNASLQEDREAVNKQILLNSGVNYGDLLVHRTQVVKRDHKGRPITDANGHLVIVIDEKPVYKRPSKLRRKYERLMSGKGGVARLELSPADQAFIEQYERNQRLAKIDAQLLAAQERNANATAGIQAVHNG